MALDNYEQVSDVAKRITVTLDDELHDWIAAQAEREERTVPNYLAWLAKKTYLEQLESQPIQKDSTAKK
jgi:CopG-like RHH_1 or ribbon-helix-helix domain, RHH_5